MQCDRDQIVDLPEAYVGTDDFQKPDGCRDATIAAIEAEGWSVLVA